MERNYASGDMDDVAVPRFDAFGARGDLRLQEGVDIRGEGGLL
jgi:hypothetical protein